MENQSRVLEAIPKYKKNFKEPLDKKKCWK